MKLQPVSFEMIHEREQPCLYPIELREECKEDEKILYSNLQGWVACSKRSNPDDIMTPMRHVVGKHGDNGENDYFIDFLVRLKGEHIEMEKLAVAKAETEVAHIMRIVGLVVLLCSVIAFLFLAIRSS